jgi:SAM-dependent methyltransferase
MSLEDESFDAVVGSSVLHHLNLACALREAHRILKPGGRIAFAEPNMMNPQIALQRKIPALRCWAAESPEETAFFRWRLARRLREAGFANVSIRPFDFLHPLVPRPLIPLVRGVGAVMEHVPLLREIAGSLLISADRGGSVACLHGRSPGRHEHREACLPASRESMPPVR